jgi:hypothetical protein
MKMGADIYLQSVWKPFAENNPPRAPMPGTTVFDEMRASGGYFRNSYNNGDVMWAMGSSWQAVGEMLDEYGYLPVDRARELVEMIEARPLTREQVIAHVFGDMCNDHPLIGRVRKTLHKLAAKNGEQPPDPHRMPTQEETDDLVAFLNKRRDELLAILRKSIELDEPLYCDL